MPHRRGDVYYFALQNKVSKIVNKNMSRRSFFLIAATVVILYFSVILLILKPLHGQKLGHSYYYFSKNSLLPFASLRRGVNLFWCKDLHWRSLPNDPVALVSFPGSGNTWLRHLLQQSTGYLTGSIYMDYALLDNGFPAENVSDGTVLVVKTHNRPTVEKNKYKSAILLIRNPRDAVLAEFNRQHKGHVGVAPKSAFRSSTEAKRGDWKSFVARKVPEWADFHRSWLTEFSGLIHVVVYERLVKDTKQTLYGILDFLNITVTNAEMECAMTNREGIYRRRKKKQDFDPFTSDMYSTIDKVHHEVMDLVRRYYNSRGMNCTTA